MRPVPRVIHRVPHLTLILSDPSVLRNITIGRLRIVTAKCTYEFPERDTNSDEEDLHAELRVLDDAFWVRLCTMGDLGFAEAYMFGDVACEDLISTFLVSTLSSLTLAISTLVNLKNCDPRCFLKTRRSLRRSTRQSRGCFLFLSESRRSGFSTRLGTPDLTFQHIMTFRTTCLKV